jgi:hypothetical protein
VLQQQQGYGARRHFDANWQQITISGQVTSFSGGVSDGNVTYSASPNQFLLGDMGGYILDSTGAKLTTSP